MSYGESKIGTPWRGYYITAYGIAVKHGFKGTEEEWLESLVGKAVEIRYNDVTNVLEWSYAGEDVWTELLSLEDLQTEVVAQTLAQAEAAKQAAQNAQTAAEAAQSAAEAAQQEAEQNAGITQADASITQTNVQLTQEAKTAAEAAQQAAQNAQQAAEAAGTDAEESATLSKSWAVGGTGTRPGEDTNNAEYWARQAAIAAGGGVLTFNGRTGNVTPEQGDYTPDQVGAADQTLSNLTDYQRALHNIGGRPNRNLLINGVAIGGGGNGHLPVNQRGQTTYLNGPAIEGWKISGNGAQKADLQADGILLTSTAQYGAYWIQNIDPADIPWLIGKTFTASCYIGANTGYNPAVAIYRNGEFWQYMSLTVNDISHITFAVPEGTTSLWYQLGSDGAGTVLFKAAKLEEGPVQTLGYKDSAGKVHLLETPDYGAELARCQQYQLALSQYFISPAVHCSTDYIDFSIPTPVEMRTAPTIDADGISIISDGKGSQTGFALSVVAKSSNAIRVRATKAAHGLSYSDGVLLEVTGGIAMLNANL